ncbi:ankyrin repeat domain-containing protein 17 [Mytilus galloprovincialis]|uniref:Ankyrin repeat domain-containing protein 17 n=1 Tax=Mytilus galloprovincialis TaxID=29158 RepID=A0A8B6C7C0_MYTGA|nr:ankyrin repeat domain-containing protein 17 [Mytilus galloprovincialis]
MLMNPHYIIQIFLSRINDSLKDWKDNDDTMFINTRAAQHVLECIKENSCVTITASSGVGKTATLRHVALRMTKEEGYDVIIVTEPGDILRFYNPNKKTLFLVDDLCGNFSLDQSDIKSWEPIMEDIKQSLNKKQMKILAACRFQVYQDEKFDALSVFKSCVCNILSKNICLSKTEKVSIAKLYLNTKASEIDDFYDIYDCFPLLCKLYHDNPELIITDFFQNPFSIYEAEIDTFLKKGHYAKYCALALCVMFNNKLKEEMLTEQVNEETRIIIENTCEACRLDRGTSRLVLQDELDSLTHTFIKKEHNVYKILHDKIFDFLVKIYGQKIIYCLIRNADSDLIKERFLLERKDDMDQFITIIPTKYHQMYTQRMIDDWSKGKVQDVFSNINMKLSQFRQQFQNYLNTLDISYQRQLANICDEGKQSKKPYFWKFEVDDDDDDDDTYDTSLLHCCYLGNISMVKWCCDHGVNINRCTYNEKTPINISCEHGHTEIVKMLLDRGADCNKGDWRRQSPVMKACKHGHTEIVKMLLDKGADCHKGDWRRQSPVMKACEHGHTEIVKMLLDRGTDCNKWDNDGQSPVMKACEHGHTEIVKMLLDRGTDCNKWDNDGQSPVMKAYEHGHTEIVKMLLEKGAEFNRCDNFGHSPLMKACEQGHSEIVKMLLDRGADYPKCTDFSQSPVMKACEHGHTEIVKMFLDKGAEFNRCDNFGHLPLMKACEHGHSEIVKMLLDKGADYNECDLRGQSPLMRACKHGHAEIVNMLLDKGADFIECDNKNESPVMKACEHGHNEIVNVLIDRGADYNKCERSRQSALMKVCDYGRRTKIVEKLLDRGADYKICDIFGHSPLMKACEHGLSEIVKMLLDKGADYNECDN